MDSSKINVPFPTSILKTGNTKVSLGKSSVLLTDGGRETFVSFIKKDGGVNPLQVMIVPLLRVTENTQWVPIRYPVPPLYK